MPMNRISPFSQIAIAAGLAAMTCAASLPALADILAPGEFAPPAVVRQLQDTPPVSIGKAVVRPLPAASASQMASGAATQRTPNAVAQASGTTLVVRARDNLVGTSSNDLVVIHPDTEAVGRAAKARGAAVKAYPEMGMVVAHMARFEQLQPLQQELARAFPAAKFDLPVRYFQRTAK